MASGFDLSDTGEPKEYEQSPTASADGSIKRDQPLEGIRVLDLTHAAAGPYAAMFLGDLGADVIKLESPGRGDGSRHMGLPLLGPLESEYYIGLNHGKRSLLIDLKAEAGIEVARSLIEKCDVLIQNFRPGVVDRLGLGYDVVKDLRPGIVYCSISAFGESGPWRDRAGNDIILQGLSGLMAMTGDESQGPVKIAPAICDFTAGLFALSGVLAGLHARDRHPDGQHIRVAMIDAAIAFMANYIPAIASGKRSRVERQGTGHAQLVPYQAFKCQDGAYLIIGAFTNAFWRRLCDAVGKPEWKDDETLATNEGRLQNRVRLVGDLGEIFATKPREIWLDLLDQADVPNTPILELQEVLELEQVKHNRSILRFETVRGDAYVSACPIRSEEWGTDTKPPPLMGEHTETILGDLLGMERDVIQQLAGESVIGLMQ